ncbi:MAG: O-methyltransferase [Egibacteraceae bacterium]
MSGLPWNGFGGDRPDWNAVDRYLTDLLVPSDPALEEALSASAAAGLPRIEVSPTQGKFLMLLARIRGAAAILEIGTLGGYSTIWLARALPPGGRLVTLERDPHHASVARANIARAGLGGLVDVRVGPALDTLARLAEEGVGPFDMTFVDADKEHNPEYLEWAVLLSRPGSVIVCDNVVRSGSVLDAQTTDPHVAGVQRGNELLARHRRLSATAVQTVGSKGWDGFALAVVTEAPESPRG